MATTPMAPQIQEFKADFMEMIRTGMNNSPELIRYIDDNYKDIKPYIQDWLLDYSGPKSIGSRVVEYNWMGQNPRYMEGVVTDIRPGVVLVKIGESELWDDARNYIRLI